MEAMDLVKIKMVAREVDKKIGHEQRKIQEYRKRHKDYVSPFELFFCKDELNEYGKAIMDVATNYMEMEWHQLGKYKKSDMENVDIKTSAITSLIEVFQYSSCSYRIGFLFWLIFIMAVDKKQAEEKLILVSDFISMLPNVEDGEIECIIEIIKKLFDRNYEIKNITYDCDQTFFGWGGYGRGREFLAY